MGQSNGVLPRGKAAFQRCPLIYVSLYYIELRINLYVARVCRVTGRRQCRGGRGERREVGRGERREVGRGEGGEGR